jgi:DNA polymerase
VSTETDDLEPAEELAALSAALRGHLRRRIAAGRLREARPALASAAEARPEAARVPPVAAAVASPPKPPPLLRSLTDNRAVAASCADLGALRTAVASCTACDLCKTRTQTVFAAGNGKARVMFVGEAPGEQEDLRGEPFVGPAGQLLTDIIHKGMGLAREDVYIANVLKCRPPMNRDPSDMEKRLCTPWLSRQIELVDPLVIVPLGRHAANYILGLEGPNARSMGSLRQHVFDVGPRKVVPTFHPSYLLRTPSDKKECWKDIQLAMKELGLSRPSLR